MLSVSCYAVHSIISKFLAIWRWAQMMSEWITFFMSFLCCQCLEAIPGVNNSSDRDSISCYKMLSEHSAFLEAGEPMRRLGPYSDTEVQLRNHIQETETSQEELGATESGETTGGPAIYIEQACGEPRGQQLVVDFSPQAGDVEIEIRSQVYDVESSSIEVTSESEPGLVQARGDHMTRAQQRANRYITGSETEETDGQPASSPAMMVASNQPAAAVVTINQHQFKDNKPPVKPTRNTVPSEDQIWEFQSCISSPMSIFRRTDPLWKGYKSDKSSVLNDSEVELKNHLYTFVSNSVEDMVVVHKEDERKVSTSKLTRGQDMENNFPTVHCKPRLV